MFLYTAFNSEGEALVHLPLDVMEGECFQSGDVDRICLMYRDCYLGEVEEFNVRYLSEGDTLRINMDRGHLSMLSRMGGVLRWRGLRASDLFNMIYQIGVSLDGQKARKPIHNFRPQALPLKPTVPDEKQQSVRWWYPRRLVQWFTT